VFLQLRELPAQRLLADPAGAAHQVAERARAPEQPPDDERLPAVVEDLQCGLHRAAQSGVWRAPHGQRLLDPWPVAIAKKTVLASLDHTDRLCAAAICIR